jgi:general nucleoside transport system ATP-binding protein
VTEQPAVALEVRNLTKGFYGVKAVDDVHFDLVGGEVHGLLGENGAGKSTLCSVLAGLYRPDAGQLVLDGDEIHLRSPHDAARLGIGMVYQHFRLVERFTVAENIVLGHRDGSRRDRSGHTVAQRIDQLAREYGLAVSPSAEVWQLSVGERQRVEILKQLYRGARILILDEPTAVLTPQESDHLFEAVRQMTSKGHAVVLVSHKTHEILTHTDRVTVLRAGRNAGGGATSTMTAATLASMLFGSAVPRADSSTNISAGDGPGPAERPVVLDVDGLVVRGDHGLDAVDRATLAVRRGEIVGVAGVAGNGQRELQEAIAGLRHVAAGSVTIAGVDCTHAPPRRRSEVGLAHVPEDRLGTGLAPGLTLEDNLVLKSHAAWPHSRRGLLRPSGIRATAAALTADFDVRGARPGMPVSFMSGGNLQKAILARELTQPHEVLLAAAPTRGLDLAAAEAVRTHLRRERETGRGVLLFSEDLAEVLELSDVVLVMFKGRIVGSFTRETADLEQIGLLMTGNAGAATS